jgi:hypothetical protein
VSPPELDTRALPPTDRPPATCDRCQAEGGIDHYKWADDDGHHAEDLCPGCWGVVSDEIESHWPAGAVSAIGKDTDLLAVIGVYADGPGPNAAVFVAESLGLTPPAIGQVEEQVVRDVSGRDLEIAEGMTWFRVGGYTAGECQYGAGYGDTFTLDGYWDLTEIDLDTAKALAQEVLANEAERWIRMTADERTEANAAIEDDVDATVRGLAAYDLADQEGRI